MKSIKFYLNYKKFLHFAFSITCLAVALCFLVSVISLFLVFVFLLIDLFGFEEIIKSYKVSLNHVLLILSASTLAYLLFIPLCEKIEAKFNQVDLIINHIFKNSVYLCGKISGLPREEVQEKFAKASLLISNLGGFYVNPLDHMIKDYTYDELCNNSKAYEEQMKVCLDLLEDCSTIFLLPDWTDSEGAKREVNFALSKGITVISLEKKKVIIHDKYSIEDLLDDKRVKLTQSDYESICKAIIKDALIGHSEIVVRNKYRFSIDFSFSEEEKKLDVYISCWEISENQRLFDIDEERLQQVFDIKVSDQNLKNIK